jgi:ABC-type hemin transport system ATPase subunit
MLAAAADEVVVLHDGRVEACGPPMEVLQPA